MLTFRGPQLCRLVGITYRQLDYWARTGLLRPSISEASGNGSSRLYSHEDARVALGIRRALDAGLSLQRVRGAIGYLRDPEGCGLLYVGGDNVVGVCNVESLAEAVAACRGVVVVVSIADIDHELTAAMAARQQAAS